MTQVSSDSQRILRERAQALARVPSAAAALESTLDLLEFRLASERYGLETRFVHEVHPLRELTPLPCTPEFVLALSTCAAESCRFWT